MAISEDTAALVAAQLTLAWATRAGPRSRHTAGPPLHSAVLGMHRHFLERLLADDAGQPEANEPVAD